MGKMKKNESAKKSFDLQRPFDLLDMNEANALKRKTLPGERRQLNLHGNAIVKAASVAQDLCNDP